MNDGSVVCRLDHILLETTGLANPAPLASVLWLDDQLESSVKLDSIVTVSFNVMYCFFYDFDFSVVIFAFFGASI